MNDCTTPAAGVKAGDKITHDLLPSFVLHVREVKPCETGGSRPGPHDQYLVADPEGYDDWLCAFEVTPVSERNETR
jgi:hypothetical protein